MSTLKYWIWLSTRNGVGSRTAVKLMDTFGTPESVYFAREEEYRTLSDLSNADIKKLSDKSLTNARKILESCENKGFHLVTIQDTQYPARLKNIYDPPILLYVWGYLPCLDEEAAIAVVGTRNCTPYGIKTAERIGYEITKAGGLIVSGLARGIDTAAAKGALRAGGKVIGIIGSGLDVFYPAENKALFYDIASVGAIISEYPPGTSANGTHFPARNRILSGVSVGVTVIEAPKKSGALITASRALEQGRDVFALPGNVDSPACEGSNHLLKEGAILATTGSEIIAEYQSLFPNLLSKEFGQENIPLDENLANKLVKSIRNDSQNQHISPKKVIDKAHSMEYIGVVNRLSNLSEEELAIISAITHDEIHVDEIIENSRLSASKVLSLLTMLEIKGCVKQIKGKRFSLNI